jgi:hypothetical protein
MSTRSLPATVDELWAAATSREPLPGADGKSGAHLERIVLDGESFVVKHLALADDWTMRGVGDVGCASLLLWDRGVLAALPDCIRQPIVAVYAIDGAWPPSASATLLMEDVGRWLVPDGDDPVPPEQHLCFLDHMARMHAAFWHAGDEIEIVPLMHRYLELGPWLPAAEHELSDDPPTVPRLVEEGWPKLRELAPEVADVVEPLALDPSPLVAELERTPQTFVHGNWKFANLGTDDAGRTVLFDWETPGRAPAGSELAWYLALNAARLPTSKEMSIVAYQAALESYGVDTEPWFDHQMALCLLGALVQFGWEKALGGPGDELDWWCDRALEGAALLP